MRKRITILGSTGSIGTQALQVLEKLGDKFEVAALSAGNNVDLLSEQIKKFNPQKVCVQSEKSAEVIQGRFKNLQVCFGDNGLQELCSDTSNDIILVAVSGKIGLKPTLTAIKNHIDIALANKETLVMAGDIVMKEAEKNGVKILPVDSEHSAIHQCLTNKNGLKRLIITASGGPFLNKSSEEMQKATVEQALAHPRWDMGKKITIDSATLMNKGLEVIEAHHLFNVDYDDIKTVVHPQSVVHSAVEYKDGSVIAQLGLPSMHIPIQYAICYPERIEGIKTNSFDFAEIAKLTFEEPDFEKFPLLKLAIECGRKGGSYTVCLNAADEEAVLAFLDGKISLGQIAEIVEEMIKNHKSVSNPDIDKIFEIDNIVRTETKKLIKEKYSK
ncbi:MAG: 1-deoxy-D-xylulose-5-phosphate reductoisomerase [Candidatus Gastranaerophilales bacterium]|nr:1-deoxy-D-xylulose-5-phosphate reductoisomerase [Candidatus Gastranaerophilales bacterium]